MRITRPQMFMEMAQIAAKRSTCMRLNVGAVIVQGRSIVSVGYNGAPAGREHCQGNSCPGRHQCTMTTHAELNALRHLPSGIRGPLDLYVTDSPCLDCFSNIIEDGRIKRIFFGTPYRLSEHLEDEKLLVDVYRVLPAGYVMNWYTKALVEVKT